MKTVRVIGPSLGLLVLAVQLSVAGEIPREPLDRVWEEHMLSGTFGIFGEGKRQEYVWKQSYESAMGMPSAAAFTKQGIIVSDLRETRFLGLWRVGGWSLEGGLLDRVQELTSSLELYGKQVTRTEPFFILGTKLWHAPKEKFSYEFFLLQRRQGVSRGTVLKKWVIRPEEIQQSNEGASPDIRAYLKYDSATKVATVSITGLKRHFEDHIDVSGAFRD